MLVFSIEDALNDIVPSRLEFLLVIKPNCSQKVPVDMLGLGEASVLFCFGVVALPNGSFAKKAGELDVAGR